ncbi:peptidylprolyl isomerase [Weissella diestrammenae]|uniref:Peptidyl-prolyl cis-trans isomerase n=1 Tax=Weissella diestrammenae TaxID=1162633 RepID=A0A7G9T662_9LACO|nr:peptidylprolyl isomerase [Weissella diestrammenae]MCM0583373.1 peptidylprolyl isomerase [Weissella diestrammenae]QNN75587.1 peptidylprolyl isomerase [Weissella diestrammenae]
MLPQFDLENVNGPIAVFETTQGTVSFKLFPEQAPKTVENFVGLIEQGYYDGIIFHRVIRDFMIQGGDPTGTGMSGESIFGEAFEDEFSKELFNFRGALSMANAGPNTNGSQFFIVEASRVPNDMVKQMQTVLPKEVVEKYAQDGGTPWLDGKHTVFGHVLKGFDVVEKIAKVAVDYADKPVEPVVITKATVVNQ